jgi:hypothetical protein
MDIGPAAQTSEGDNLMAGIRAASQEPRNALGPQQLGRNQAFNQNPRPGTLNGPLFFRHQTQKKPAWSNTLEALDHAGLLCNEPPDTTEVPFI